MSAPFLVCLAPSPVDPSSPLLFFLDRRFAYGFLNSISMAACGIAPFVYTALLAIFSKTVVWLLLASTFVILFIVEVVNQVWRFSAKRKRVAKIQARKPKSPGGQRPNQGVLHVRDGPESQFPDLASSTTASDTGLPELANAGPFFDGEAIIPVPAIFIEDPFGEVQEGGPGEGGELREPAGEDEEEFEGAGPRMRSLSQISNTKMAFAATLLGQSGHH